MLSLKSPFFRGGESQGATLPTMRLLLVFSVVLLGCPPPNKTERKDVAPLVCAKVGQSCEVAPGKLGTCVMNDRCVDPTPACFVCQSQH